MNKDKFHALTRAERMSDNIVNLLCCNLRASVGKPLEEDLANQVMTVLYDQALYKNTVRRTVQEAER